jgi:hypothetical protein
MKIVIEEMANGKFRVVRKGWLKKEYFFQADKIHRMHDLWEDSPFCCTEWDNLEEPQKLLLGWLQSDKNYKNQVTVIKTHEVEL